MATILLHRRCPEANDPEVLKLLELTARVTGATSVELELTPEKGETRRYRIGQKRVTGTSHRLDLPPFDAVIHLGGAVAGNDDLPVMITFALNQILLCRRYSEQVSLLQGALDTTASAVLLFDTSGDIVYANPPADRLLSRQTEDDLEVESSGQRSQPMFMRIWSMVEKVLDGRATQLPWTTTLVLSDGSVLACEIMKVDLASRKDGMGVLVLLQSLPALPSLFLDAFCARHRISPREQEVIGLLLEGLGTADMADRLAISEHTIRDHLKRLYRKTGTRSRSELLSILSTARMEPSSGSNRKPAVDETV